MRAPDRLDGQRVVADADAVDRLLAALPPETIAFRFAPDEALVVGATVELDDPDAIVVDEVAFVALTFDREVIERHVEWPLPQDGKLGQGAIAGVPAKVSSLPDGRVRVVVHVAYLAELEDRLR